MKTRGPKGGPDAPRKINRRRIPGERDPVDVHIGNRVRQRRTMLGLSQGKLGEAVGLTFQQIQKYEKGSNRMGSSRLYDLSYVLDVPISYFFEEMPNEVKKRNDNQATRSETSRSTETIQAFLPSSTGWYVPSEYVSIYPIPPRQLFVFIAPPPRCS